ncbi:MAG: molybdopterin molybdotransferase MoeA [Armatimonadetes bacterium]|nr:molybdopterin molybdotransferase MoeA [Armatimonadota bacterium]MDW8153628.1 molybdopterin molybdotransferase MoeA [Armatimonadota bacterium]
MRTFTQLVTVEEALERFLETLRPQPRGREVVPLEQSLDRVVATDLAATQDLPPFDRSTVDGFAVRAGDVEEATEDHPAHLRVVGEVRMGEVVTFEIGPREAARIPTGGMLPGGADAVVMQEHCRLAADQVEVLRPVASGENVIRQGQDVRRGEVVVPAGTRLRPQELALLAGLGIVEVPVWLAPRVAIFSTGDEVVPPDHLPRPGQVRDMNTYALTGLVARLGGVPLPGRILPDEEEAIGAALQDALRTSEVVLVSGGSSVGARDVLASVIPRLGAPGILVHGVAIKPGKPTLLAVCRGRAVVGLPGHPVSAQVAFQVFVRPALEAMLGLRPDLRGPREVPARLHEALRAPRERDEFVRVAVRWENGELVAEPIRGLSGMITTLTRADGYVRVPRGATLPQGSVVRVRLLD